MDGMDRARLIAELSTVCAIPVTPFGPSGEVDWEAYGAVVERIVAGGVTVVTPNGNTGEFYALSAAECDRAVEVTAEALTRVGPGSGGGADRLAGAGAGAGEGGAGVLLMPGVGLDVATAVARGRVAARSGARAVMVHQPVHPYQSAEGWVAYHLAIAEGLPELGIVPYVRDPSVTPAMLARLAGAPNVVGVKYAVPNPLQFASTVVAVAGATGGQAGGEPPLAWVCGLAEGWAPFFWPGGAVGFTSGLVNLVAGPSMGLLAALQKGDYPEAMAIWRRVKPFEDLRARRSAANNVPVVKEALAQLGVCGRTVRPPISEVPEAEREEVAALLAGLGVTARAPAGAAV
jgi:4-hydroxy-tetrahydrodipicolinate synthase